MSSNFNFSVMYILIPRKCPRKTLFQHTVPPPSEFSEHPTALNLLMLMAPSSTSFLNNESARLLPDKRHSKVGTRPEAFHNVCQNWPFFQPFWNQTSNMNRTRKCLINLNFHSMWILLVFAFWKTFDILKSVIKPHTCWSCSSVLSYSIRMLCILLYPEVLINIKFLN